MECAEIIGKKFNSLRVVSLLREVKIEKKSPTKKGRVLRYYLCQCDCGEETEVRRDYLLTDHTKSCGCLKKIKGKNNKCWSGHEEISGRLWTHIKRHAKTRDLEFNVTIEDAWKQFEKQKGCCALTGIEIGFNYHKGAYNCRTASLDRIDSNRGYTNDNIQWLHKDVNWMKGKFPSSRFVELCLAVAKHQRGKSC